MQLIDWIKANRLTLSGIAEEWGIHKATLSRIVRGTPESYPTFPMIVRAWVLTGGKVGISDWIDLFRPKLEAEGIVPPPAKPNGDR